MDAQDLIAELECHDAEASNEDKLRLAQMALQFAIELMEEVVEATGDRHAEAYLVDQLKTHVSANHGFLCDDYNIDQWVEDLDGDDPDGAEDADAE